MAYEIIYVCNSINNKNVRSGELNILEKHEEQLYFEFGSDKMNIKKRFYNDIETLNKDFNALLKLKNKEKQEEKEYQENKAKNKKENLEKKSEEIKTIAEAFIKNQNKDEEDNENDEGKASPKTGKYKIIKRKK